MGFGLGLLVFSSWVSLLFVLFFQFLSFVWTSVFFSSFFSF